MFTAYSTSHITGEKKNQQFNSIWVGNSKYLEMWSFHSQCISPSLLFWKLNPTSQNVYCHWEPQSMRMWFQLKQGYRYTQLNEIMLDWYVLDPTCSGFFTRRKDTQWEWPWKVEASGCCLGVIGQDLGLYQKLEQMKEGLLKNCYQAQPCQHLSFGLLLSRTVRQQVFFFLFETNQFFVVPSMNIKFPWYLEWTKRYR